MKKIIFLLCLSVPVSGWAATIPAEDVLCREMQKQVVTQKKQDASVHGQLLVIAQRLGKELNREVTPQQVVSWLYDSYTFDFEEVAYYQFKWERAQRFEELLSQPGHDEEFAELNEYIPRHDPRVKEFTKYWRHVIDYSFAQVFAPTDRENLFDYGNGAANYNEKAYAPVKNKKKFTEDTTLEINNLRAVLGFFIQTDDKTFRDSWFWLFEEE